MKYRSDLKNRKQLKNLSLFNKHNPICISELVITFPLGNSNNSSTHCIFLFGCKFAFKYGMCSWGDILPRSQSNEVAYFSGYPFLWKPIQGKMTSYGKLWFQAEFSIMCPGLRAGMGQIWLKTSDVFWMHR